MGRRAERKEAVFAVYQTEITGRPLEALATPPTTPYSRALAEAVSANATVLDRLIDRHAHGWRIDRIHPLERAIMRVAVQEMVAPPAVAADHPIPPEGAIEEAVALAGVYCEKNASAFVNGVLDAVLRTLRDEGEQVPLRERSVQGERTGGD